MSQRRFQAEDALRLRAAADPARTPSQAVDYARQLIAWNQRHDPGSGKRRGKSRG